MSVLTEYFRAVEALCAERGLRAERFDSNRPGYLGVRVSGKTNVWELHVDCDEDALTLPNLRLGGSKRVLAHAGYWGTVCVNDGQGMSLDPDRRPDIAARTVVEGYELLERSAIDAANGQAEFFNELEGYWAALPNACTGRATFEVDANDRLLTAHLDTQAAARVWWLTEYGQPAPRDFRPEKAITQRALYVHLDRVSYEEATARVFGRPSKRCRGTT